MSYNNQVFASGAAVAADFNSPPFSIKGGHYVLAGMGTFGGGALKLQFSPDNPPGATWVDMGPQNGVAMSLSNVGSQVFDLCPGRYRVTFSGSAGAALTYYFGEANQGG